VNNFVSSFILLLRENFENSLIEAGAGSFLSFGASYFLQGGYLLVSS